MTPTESSFGALIRSRRLSAPGQPTLREMGEVLGLSPGMYSDIEQGRRRPFQPARIEAFCRYLHLPESDRILLYDLAAIQRGVLPGDVNQIMLHSDVGTMALAALRLTNAGAADEEDWKQFIRQIQERQSP